MDQANNADATMLLTALTSGTSHAADELTPIVYDQLRSLASSYLAQERPDHTLQPTALVHEAYVRLIDQRSVSEDDKAAFMGLASTIMRRVLVDHARAKKRLKRGGGGRRVELRESQMAGQSGDGSLDVEDMDQALIKLAELDPRKARLIELRFFGGLGETEAADMIGISRATASREWRMARSWLVRELSLMDQATEEADRG
ncbi:MAG: sigma-70 family RNA polymerase sigma factor [Phycisphaera sp.]|nr:MAG: sigma-70 family RNA polymerase sigma factor [Phycisphaera sp.]